MTYDERRKIQEQAVEEYKAKRNAAISDAIDVSILADIINAELSGDKETSRAWTRNLLFFLYSLVGLVVSCYFAVKGHVWVITSLYISCVILMFTWMKHWKSDPVYKLLRAFIFIVYTLTWAFFRFCILNSIW